MQIEQPNPFLSMIILQIFGEWYVNASMIPVVILYLSSVRQLLKFQGYRFLIGSLIPEVQFTATSMQ